MSLNSIFLYLNKSFVASCDAAEPWQLGFQDPATPAMEGMIDFHNMPKKEKTAVLSFYKKNIGHMGRY